MLSSLAVVLEQPERIALSTAPARRAGGGRCRGRNSVERRQRWHRAPSVHRPNAAISGHGLPARSRLRERRAKSSRRGPRPRSKSAPGSSCPAPAASEPVAGIHGGSASHLVARPPRVAPVSVRARRKRGAHRPGRNRAARARRSRDHGRRSYRRPRRSRPAARAPSRAPWWKSPGRMGEERLLERAAPSATT